MPYLKDLLQLIYWEIYKTDNFELWLDNKTSVESLEGKSSLYEHKADSHGLLLFHHISLLA